MDQLERITYMEKILDEATEAVSALQNALERYIALQDRVQELAAYYGSAQWRQDFDDDSAGKLPQELKRGVLSEDAVYDLLCECSEMEKQIKGMAVL